jgi:plasmid stabilization system protein ParE
MRFSLDILPDAIADITEAAHRYERQCSGLGTEFAEEVNAAIDSLSLKALIFRVRYRRKGVRWLYPLRFPYRICYYVEAQTVHVFAVIRAARHDRQWTRRL